MFLKQAQLHFMSRDSLGSTATATETTPTVT